MVQSDHLNLVTEGRDRPSVGMNFPQMATELYTEVLDNDLSLFRAMMASSILQLSFLTIRMTRDYQSIEIALHLLGDI